MICDQGLCYFVKKILIGRFLVCYCIEMFELNNIILFIIKKIVFIGN